MGNITDEVLLGVRMITGLTNNEIISIAGNKSVIDAYMDGKYCNHCPLFNKNCLNEPAITARSGKRVKFTPDTKSVIETIMLLTFLEELLGAIGDLSRIPGEDKDELPEEFKKFMKERGIKD